MSDSLSSAQKTDRFNNNENQRLSSAPLTQIQMMMKQMIHNISVQQKLSDVINSLRVLSLSEFRKNNMISSQIMS